VRETLFLDCEAIASSYNEQAPQTCSHYTDTTEEVDFLCNKKLTDLPKTLTKLTEAFKNDIIEYLKLLVLVP
jgi:hypothetical protein